MDTRSFWEKMEFNRHMAQLDICDYLVPNNYGAHRWYVSLFYKYYKKNGYKETNELLPLAQCIHWELKESFANDPRSPFIVMSKHLT